MVRVCDEFWYIVSVSNTSIGSIASKARTGGKWVTCFEELSGCVVDVGI